MASKREPLSEATKARLRRRLDFEHYVDATNNDAIRDKMLELIYPLAFQPSVARNLSIENGAADLSPRISITKPHNIDTFNGNVAPADATITGKTQVLYDVPGSPDDARKGSNTYENSRIYRRPSALLNQSGSKLSKPHLRTI